MLNSKREITLFCLDGTRVFMGGRIEQKSLDSAASYKPVCFPNGTRFLYEFSQCVVRLRSVKERFKQTLQCTANALHSHGKCSKLIPQRAQNNHCHTTQASGHTDKHWPNV